MRKIKRPKLGQYVFVSKFGDKDPYDPWAAGFVVEIIENCFGIFVKLDCSLRLWRHIWKITEEEGKEFLKHAD